MDMNPQQQEAGSPDPNARLTRFKEMFEEARDNTQESRKEAEIDSNYYHGKQWTQAELNTLKKRKQPPITYNLVRSKIESICGVEENTETSPKAWPRTPQDEKAAEIATDTLRYVTDKNRFAKTRIDVLRDMIVRGTGGAMVEVEQKGPNRAQLMSTTAMTPSEPRYEIKIRKLRWETIFYDPYARETDFSDARYMGLAQWMDADDAIAFFGEQAKGPVEAALNDSGLYGSRGAGFDSYEDRPLHTWADKKRRRVLVVEAYYREGLQWHRTVFTGGGVIEDSPSAYLNEDGVPTNPIELVSCYVDDDNNRYGLIRDQRSPQDEVNARRSKLLHLLNTRQTFRKEGAISGKDPQKMRRELNKPDGDVVIARTATWGEDIGIIDTNLQMQGQAELLAEAKAFLDRLGPNNALQGRGTEDQSGRAILAQQQAGLAELATVFSAHNDWMLRIFRQIWARARQFWTEPMWIRVTDELEAPKFIQLNEVVGFEPVVDANGYPQVQFDPQTGMPVIDPRTGQVQTVPPKPIMQNRIAEMGVDLIVDRVPASASIVAEQFSELVELAKAGMPIPPQAIIMASMLRNKKQILDFIEQQSQQQAGAGHPPPEVVQAELDGKLAETEHTRAKTQEIAAKIVKMAHEVQQPQQPAGPGSVPGGAHMAQFAG